MRTALAAAFVAIATPALANDTMANLEAGGLVFVHSNVVAIASEDLFISEQEVRVDYVFKNLGEKTVESLIAFPMPDIVANPYVNVAIPDLASDNFLDFEASADGTALSPALDQRVFAVDVDVTEDLKNAGVPLFPYVDGMEAAIAALSQDVRDDWIDRGILIVDTYDDGNGMIDHYVPAWTLKSTYWWKMTFPAGKEISVKHRYSPSVGGSVGLGFVSDGAPGGPGLDEYRRKYCLDASIERAVKKGLDRGEEGSIPFSETWLSYILTTGGNWATNIQKFRLTIDKGDPKALVSFCGEGVRKTGPTTFEMTAENFYPERDLDILILKKPDAAR